MDTDTVTMTRPDVAGTFITDSLPSAVRVLAVTARPLQESADLGGLLYAFRRAGASLSLLCLTRGEASVWNSGPGRLESARPWEVQLAASVVGIAHVSVASYRDGGLHQYRTPELAARIRLAISEYSADLVLVVDPETGDVADIAVARAATAAAARSGVPLAASTRPGVSGAWMIDLGPDAETARAIQKSAAAAHASQEEALPGLMDRLDRLGKTETLRWLLTLPVAEVPGQRVSSPDERAVALVPRARS
jgi:LmbE family N-acetylglucosaminyl deacetylase